MNERIKELVGQALKQPDTDKDGLTVFDNDELEKFAVSIVRECAGICESMPLLGPYKEVQDATLKDAAVQIKKHFGVK